MTDTQSPKPAEQDPEYLDEAHGLMCRALEGRGIRVEDRQTMASDILDALAAAGWHLLTAEDSEKLLSAYVLQEVRAGRVTRVSDQLAAEVGGDDA